MNKKVILWTTPRSVSTAFHRSITTLKKTKWFLEVFTGIHYFSPSDSRFDLSPKVQADSEIPQGFYVEGVTSVKDLTYEAMMNLLSADYPDVDLVFSKEFAFCLPETMWEDMVTGKFANAIHTFLIREPERVLYSNYSTGKPAYLKVQPCVDPPGGGLYELYDFYKFIKEKRGAAPVVVDATDLQAHPDETMKSYCEAVGILFDPNMTSWDQGFSDPFAYSFWEQHWFSTIKQSTGFIKTKPEEQKPAPLHELPSQLLKWIEETRVQYTEMRKDRIKPLPL